MSATLALEIVTNTVTKTMEYRKCVECGEIQDREDMIECLICGQFMCSMPGIRGRTHLCSCPVNTSDSQ